MTVALIVLVLFGLSGCCMRSAVNVEPAREKTRLFEAITSPARASIVLVHGLNQRPSSFDQLAMYLAGEGFEVLRLSLTGTGADPSEFACAETWAQDVHIAYTTARERNQGKPVHMIGYSLGGLLIAHNIALEQSFRPDAVYLLAPAIALTTLGELGRLSEIPPLSRLAIPSWAPREYRRMSGVPLRWYRNLFDLRNTLDRSNHDSRLADVPVRIRLSRRDELVSFDGIEEWMKRRALDTVWKLQVLERKPDARGLPRHLIVDERSLGYEGWRDLLADIVEHFTSSSRD